MLMRVSRCMRRRRCWLSVACSPYFPWGFTLGFVLLARWSWKSLGYFCGIANKCMFSVPVVGAQATEAGRSAVVFYWSLKCMGQKVEYTGCTKYDCVWVFWEIHSIWTAWTAGQQRGDWQDHTGIVSSGRAKMIKQKLWEREVWCLIRRKSYSLSLAKWSKMPLECFEPIAK